MNHFSFKNYDKIILVGCCGSGKSWFAKRLAEKTGLPLIHLDNEYWKPGWAKTPKDEWITRQKELIKAEQWIIDGNYNGTMELRFAAADLVIFPDINRYICFWSALRRRGKKRSDLPSYLNETALLSKQSIELFSWIWSYSKTGRKTIMDLHTKYPKIEFLHIKSRKQMQQMLGG